MNSEIQKIIRDLQEGLNGDPWYGKSFQNLLAEISPDIVYQKLGENSHSLIDLIYHMVTWSDFTKQRLCKDTNLDLSAFTALDWRETITSIHTWNNGISEFTASTNAIIEILKSCNDDLLQEKVDYRDYNFNVLLNGLVQHNIYHIGQIAFLSKALS